MMIKAFLLSVVVVIVASNQNGLVVEQSQGIKQLPSQDLEAQKLPSFCNGIICPMFKQLNKTSDYEVRLYPKTSWMSTNLKGVSYKSATSEMFMKLFKYIQGRNEKKEEIPMTCPVLNKIIPGPGATCKSDFIMSFFNNPSLGKPPAPTDTDIFVSNMDASVVYVRSFGGYANYEDYRNNALKLGAALEKDGLGFVTEYYYTAGYDSPFKIFNRHNEVWFMKK